MHNDFQYQLLYHYHHYNVLYICNIIFLYFDQSSLHHSIHYLIYQILSMYHLTDIHL
nr:MAG TPA: hypothetical protein [Caudoviricetes sp.]